MQPPEGDMDVSDTEEDALPCAQTPLSREGLTTVLTRKMKLRRKLLRADYHRAFLHKCRTANVTPKGLRLSLLAPKQHRTAYIKSAQNSLVISG